MLSGFLHKRPGTRMSMSQAELNGKINASKKIAQLTKVIFRLQTESLGRKDFVAHVKKECDQEM
jgi:hypothetical protein